MAINEKYENVDDYKFIEKKSKSMKPKYRKITMEDLFDDDDAIIVDEELNEIDAKTQTTLSKDPDSKTYYVPSSKIADAVKIKDRNANVVITKESMDGGCGCGGKKTLKEGGCGCGGGKTLREADIMGRRSLPGAGGAVPALTVTNKSLKDSGKENRDSYEASMKKVAKYNDIKLKQPFIDNEGVIKTATSADDKYTKKYPVKDEEAYYDQLARTGSGMESLDYDVDPSDEWKEKFKKNLNGDESFMSKLTKKRKEIKLNSPVYNIFPRDGKIGDQVNVFNGIGKNKNIEKLNRQKGRMKESVASIVDRIIEEAIAISEGKKAKPDFLDLDKDGDKKESMKKAAKDAKMKKVKPSMKKSKIFKKKEMKESEGGWMTILDNNDMKEINSTPQPIAKKPSDDMKISTGFATVNLGTLRVENAENLDKVVIPNEYQINGLVFEIADNNRTAKVRFEEGELIVLADKNKKMINEEASKIMKLMNYNYNTKPAAKSVVNEDVNATLKKMLNEVKGLAKE